MPKTQLFVVLISIVIALLSFNAKQDWKQRAEALEALKRDTAAAAAECSEKHAGLEAKVKQLEETLAVRSVVSAVSAAATEPPAEKAPAAAPEHAHSAGDQSFRVRARISAIEKFVPLNDDQRSRLEEKFKRDLSGTAASEESSKDELAEILGAENAEYYRKETRRVFEQAEAEERERDVYFLSRRLSLNQEQEEKVTQAIIQAEAAVEVQRKARQQEAAGAATMQDRIRLILEDNKLRQKLLGEQLQKIFSAEQYRIYLEQRLDSTEGSFPVFHESE